MTEIIKARGSAIPRIEKCTASKDAPEVAINSTSDIAAMGSCVHEPLADLLKDKIDLANIDFQYYATKHGVEDIDELKMLFWAGVKAWNTMKGSLRLLHVEEKLEGFMNPSLYVNGTGDFIAETENMELLVGDWKSGYIQSDYRAQLMCYLFLISLKMPKYTKFKYVIIWLRLYEIEIVDISKEQLDDWVAELEKKMQTSIYSPGTHCTYCPKEHECEAKQGLVRSSILDLMVTADSGLEMSPQLLASQLPRVKMIEKAIEKYKTILKATVDEHGSIDCGDEVLKFIEKQTDKIHFEESWKTLTTHFGLNEEMSETLKLIAPSITVGKTKLMKVVGNHAPKGMKGKVIEGIIEELHLSGGMTKKTSRSLSFIKKEAKNV